MTRKNQILSAVVALIVLIGVYFVVQHLRWVETDNASIQAHAVLLSPKVNGFLSEVNVQEGDLVKKDQILSKMDARDYENSLEQLKAQRRSLEARYADAARNYRRQQDLVKSGSVSQQQFDTSKTLNVDVAASIDSLDRQINQAQLNIDYTIVKAPSDGKIAKKSAELGQFVAAGTPLFGFVSSESRWVVANFKETDLDDIHVGALAEIDVDAFNGKTYQGKVEAISSATGSTFTLLPPDNATGNFTKVVQRIPVRITLDGMGKAEYEKFPSGASVIVRVRRP